MKNFRFVVLLAILFLSGGDVFAQWRQLPMPSLPKRWTGVYDIAFLGDSIVVVASDSGIYRSNIGEYSWHNRLTSFVQVKSLIEVNETLYAGGIANNGILSSTDCGLTWNVGQAGDTSIGYGRGFLYDGEQLFAATSRGIKKLMDTVWAPRYDNVGISREISALSASGGVYFAAARSGTLFRSLDRGATWDSVWNFSGTLWTVYADKDVVFLGLTAAAHRSVDSGKTWTKLPYPWTTSGIRFVRHGQYLFGCFSTGFGISEDDGVTWRQVEKYPGSTLPVINCAIVHNDTLYIGTGEWIWYRPLSEVITPISSADDGVAGVSRTSLGQSIPNPVNAETAIPYVLAASGHVTLAMFNTIGQEVAVPVDAPQSAGAHTAMVNTTNLPVGIYYYRLSAGGVVLTRSMIVAR